MPTKKKKKDLGSVEACMPATMLKKPSGDLMILIFLHSVKQWGWEIGVEWIE